MSIVIVICYCKRGTKVVQFKIDPSRLPISRHFKKTRVRGICLVPFQCVFGGVSVLRAPYPFTIVTVN